jgi:endonuclease/exonuclease/phosphatase family metal-dependent hydrolase
MLTFRPVLLSPSQHQHPSAAAEARPASLRVVTFNAASLKRPEETRDMLASLDAGIVCLQEVLVERKRAPHNQAEWLAGELGYHCAFSADWRRPHGTGGNAVLTRTPPVEVAVLADRAGGSFALAMRQQIGGVRFALVTAHCLPVPMAPLRFLCAIGDRSAQMRRLVAWVCEAGLPCIVGGDLNALPHSPEYRIMARALADCTRAVAMSSRNTRPTLGLPAQLDYIFATRDVRTRACRLGDAGLSDHRPVVADLEIFPRA